MREIFLTPLVRNAVQIAADLDDPDRRDAALADLEVLTDRATCLNLIEVAKVSTVPGYQAAALKCLEAGTGEPWFPCHKCGAPVGPANDYGCHDQHCPICGSRCWAEGGCSHFVGWWCEWVGGTWADVDWPEPLAGEIPDGVRFEILVPSPEVVFGDAWEVFSDCYDTEDALLEAYNSVVDYDQFECALTGMLLRHAHATCGLLSYEFEPAGASPGTGVTDSYFARDAEKAEAAGAEIARIMRLIRGGLERLVVG